MHTSLVLLILSEIPFPWLNGSKYHRDFEKDAREVYPFLSYLLNNEYLIMLSTISESSSITEVILTFFTFKEQMVLYYLKIQFFWCFLSTIFNSFNDWTTVLLLQLQQDLSFSRPLYNNTCINENSLEEWKTSCLTYGTK